MTNLEFYKDELREIKNKIDKKKRSIFIKLIKKQGQKS